jgi:hypothetical protein
MSETASNGPCGRLKLANQLDREYNARCFWHRPRSLRITEELIPFVIRGLRAHGGRRGFILSGMLRSNSLDDRKCR